MTTTVIPAGYAISYRLVASVDNQGEPCDVCDVEGAEVECTVYGQGGYGVIDLTTDCCAECALKVAVTMSPTAEIVVEHVAASDDTLMHSQYCECVHPDGE